MVGEYIDIEVYYNSFLFLFEFIFLEAEINEIRGFVFGSFKVIFIYKT